ncbi:hypothetical protein L798_12987 [Zootermopsis nevadensis]|uniref:Uncharacterized protein n=2 Tax=Zootermopsis nevadensis TaxID=136037 RepID=A0A067R2I6_ZOONE|nr:hypothetical protein L798_12987 [Zootermopsis nevadensis]
MSKKRNPVCLKELIQHEICTMINRPFVTWIYKLYSSEELGWRQRLPVFQLVLKQCVELKEYLMSLPESACKLLMEKIFKTVSAIIASYHLALCSRLGALACRLQYEEVCLYMLRVVFLPCIKECNIRDIQNVFVQELVSQSLHTNPNITRLILPHIPTTKVVRSVFSSFESLAVLQEFSFEFSCTADIVIELGKHCKLLKVLDITGSKLVNDECVQYLLNMRNLEKLYVSETKISETCYAVLISSLPRIQNITWLGPVECILKNIRKKRLPKVNEFLGVISDVPLVRKLCPHIKKLSVCLQTKKSLDLIHLTEIVSLEFTSSDYYIHNLRIIIECMGIRLTKLDFAAVRNVDITHIISCCPVLKILNLALCEIVISENFTFAPELQHFKSVQEITFVRNSGFEYFLKFLHLYVNLELFHAEGVREIQDMCVSAILKAGGFRKLSKILLGFCGLLTLQTAMMLIENCDNLCLIGKLDTWSGVNGNDRIILLDFVRTNNLAHALVLK